VLTPSRFDDLGRSKKDGPWDNGPHGQAPALARTLPPSEA
jgi:hypothetical protein